MLVLLLDLSNNTSYCELSTENIGYLQLHDIAFWGLRILIMMKVGNLINQPLNIYSLATVPV